MEQQRRTLFVLCAVMCMSTAYAAYGYNFYEESTENARMPWQVAIYRNKMLTCSGTLLSRRVILTAAHCVTDSNGHVRSSENYTIAVGKLYKQYNDTNDNDNVQFSSIHDITIPTQYRGEVQNYFGDIAILITKDSIKLSEKVQPIALNRNETLTRNFNSNGSVSSWHFHSAVSMDLNLLGTTNVSTMSAKQCEVYVGDDFREYLTDDKFCARYLNSESLCKGSNGEGLVVKHDNKSFLVGVASVSLMPPSNKKICDDEQISLYTDVSYYIRSFAKDKLAEYGSP